MFCICRQHGLVSLHGSASIEDDMNSVHVDFANKSLGGGVLSGGYVQEEIYFARRPELIALVVISLICVFTVTN